MAAPKSPLSKRQDQSSPLLYQWPIWLPETNADVVIWSVLAAVGLIAAFAVLALLASYVAG
jgi:hypothetical protein